MQLTGGKGADALVDCLSYVDTKSTQQCIFGVKRGGTIVCLGGATGDLTIPYGYLLGTEISLTGSIWFHSYEAAEMVNMATAGRLNLNVFEVRSFSLDQINEAIEYAGSRVGGMITSLVKF
jgi:alcohol dehydrogenase